MNKIIQTQTETQTDEVLNIDKYIDDIKRIEDYRSVEYALPVERDASIDLANIIGMIDRY